MVVCPTRELADQVCKEIRRLARFTQNIKVLALSGGVPFGPQAGSLEHGVTLLSVHRDGYRNICRCETGVE